MAQEIDRSGTVWDGIKGAFHNLAEMTFEIVADATTQLEIDNILAAWPVSIDDVMQNHMHRRIHCVTGTLRLNGSTFEIVSAETRRSYPVTSDSLLAETAAPVRIAGHIVHGGESGVEFKVLGILDPQAHEKKQAEVIGREKD